MSGLKIEHSPDYYRQTIASKVSHISPDPGLAQHQDPLNYKLQSQRDINHLMCQRQLQKVKNLFFGKINFLFRVTTHNTLKFVSKKTTCNQNKINQ